MSQLERLTSKRSRKVPLTPEEQIHANRVRLLGRLLKNYQLWECIVRDEGLLYITIDGEEWHFFDLLDGIKTLPPRQKEALIKVYLEDKREVDAAREMGFVKWSTPVQQYASLALERLLKFHDEARGGQDGQ